MYKVKISIFLVGFALLTFAPSTYAATAQGQHSASVTHTNLANTCSWPTVRLGSNDNDYGWPVVSWLQISLNRLYGYYSEPDWFVNYPYDFGPYTQDPNHPLQVDGDFGTHTYNAVRDYQWSNGLTVDGIVGPQTWSSLGLC